jgi:hypothetical protein
VSAACTPPLLQGWNRAATCTPCGEGPWLSDRASSIDILDPNTGKTTEVRHVRGSPESCLIQQGMGVTKLSFSGVLQAVICPVNFLGSSEIRHGLAVAPCAACPKLTVTAGNDRRALSYSNTAGEAVAIVEGGYYSVAACKAAWVRLLCRWSTGVSSGVLQRRWQPAALYTVSGKCSVFDYQRSPVLVAALPEHCWLKDSGRPHLAGR